MEVIRADPQMKGMTNMMEEHVPHLSRICVMNVIFQFKFYFKFKFQFKLRRILRSRSVDGTIHAYIYLSDLLTHIFLEWEWGPRDGTYRLI